MGQVPERFCRRIGRAVCCLTIVVVLVAALYVICNFWLELCGVLECYWRAWLLSWKAL